MNFRVALSVLAVSAAISTPAFAQSPWYAGASVGQSSVDIDNTIGGLPVTARDEEDIGYKLFAGYQLNRNFAIEGGWVDLGKFSATTAAGKADVKASGWNISALGILPLNDQWSLFAKLGTIYAEVKTGGIASGKDRDWSAGYGFGAQYNISKAVALRAEWEKFDSLGGNNSAKGDVNLYSVGLTFKF